MVSIWRYTGKRFNSRCVRAELSSANSSVVSLRRGRANASSDARSVWVFDTLAAIAMASPFGCHRGLARDGAAIAGLSANVLVNSCSSATS
jgi:hypothetical protein